jgi:hypothetical protein
MDPTTQHQRESLGPQDHFRNSSGSWAFNYDLARIAKPQLVLSSALLAAHRYLWVEWLLLG